MIIMMQTIDLIEDLPDNDKRYLLDKYGITQQIIDEAEICNGYMIFNV